MGQRVTVGRTVLYRLAEDVVRPAVIVQVWSEENGCSNLQVFIDGTNDAKYVGHHEVVSGLHWATSRTCGDGVGEWQWPTRE
jgi:hypothetical protein